MFVQHRQRLEITLDMFRGCAHSCSGCMIDRTLGGAVDDLVPLQALLQEMVAAGFVAFDLGIGPTDFMSADNVDELMYHPVFRELAQMFGQVTFQTALLDKDLDNYTKMCSLIDEACPNKDIRFLIPGAPDFFKTPKYGEMIAAKLRHVKETLRSAKLNEAGFVINCTRDTVGDNFDTNLHQMFDIKFPVEKDDILSIPYGRSKGIDIMLGQNIKDVSHRISQYYTTLEGCDERFRNPDRHEATGTMQNLLYTGGKLYWVPFLKDEFAFLNDAFAIPRPWTMEAVLKARTEAIEKSLDFLAGTECIECPLLHSCAEKGITAIMELLSVRDCIVGDEYVRIPE